MRVSQSFGGLAAGALMFAALAAPAGAKTLVSISGTASPAIAAHTKTPQPLRLSVDVRFSSDVAGDTPGTLTRSVIFFPRGARVNGSLFRSCDPGKLRRAHGAPRACPAGSRLGGGKVRGTSPQFPDTFVTLKLDVYNGPGGRSLLFYLRGGSQADIDGLIEGSLAAMHSHRWGYRLTLKVPHGLQELADGIFTSLLHVQATVGATTHVREHGRLVRRGYIEARSCPPGALMPVGGAFDFRGGSSTTTSSSIACK